MATKRLKRPRDPVELGKLIGDILTGQVEDAAPDDGKDKGASELGRLGGLKGGKARAVCSSAGGTAKPPWNSWTILLPGWRIACN
jgi:hypothetical protein